MDTIQLSLNFEECIRLSLEERAREFGLCARIIQDAGHTQVVPGSATVLGIGPGNIILRYSILEEISN